MASGGVAGLPAAALPDSTTEIRRTRPRRGSRALGKSSGEFGVTRWVQSWARHQRRGTRGHGPRRSGLMAAELNSGERLHGQKSRECGIMGMRRLVTSRDGSGVLEQRRGRSEDLGRWWRRHGCTMRSPVSANRGK
jgi:hypothetical protein